MGQQRESLRPVEGADRSVRRRLTIRVELAPALLPTSLTFALRTGAESELALFGLALAVVAILVVLQRAAL